jgi:LL-diaminopimelate aminotransferase
MTDGMGYVYDTQDPSYPVYVDSSVIMGMTGNYDDSSKGFGGIEYMVCRPENDFFPDLSKVRTGT